MYFQAVHTLRVDRLFFVCHLTPCGAKSKDSQVLLLQWSKVVLGESNCCFKADFVTYLHYETETLAHVDRLGGLLKSYHRLAA